MSADQGMLCSHWLSTHSAPEVACALSLKIGGV